MCKRLFFLISIILVLGLIGNASADLVARWTFDDETANDSSGNSHHGTLVAGDGTTSVSIVYDADRGSNVLNCSNPEGHTINSVVDCGTGTWADITPIITMAAWTKANTIWHATGCYLLSKGSAYQFTAIADVGIIRVYSQQYPNPYREFYGTSSLLDGKWHHVAYTHDEESRRMYFDGELEAEEFIGSEGYTHGDALIIGGRLSTNFDHRGWDGRIDDVRLYDRVLSHLEIREIAGACAEPACEWVLLDGELNTPRHGLTGEAIDGYIYSICGGNASNSWGTNVVEKYDPSSDSWEYDCSTGDLAKRHSLSSDVIDGCIYAVGGHYSNSRSENDIFCGTCPPSWQSGASVYARSGPGVAAGCDGKLYVFGGNHYATILSRFDIYDPCTDTWSYGGEMPAATEPWRATTLNCKIYLTTGSHVDPKKVWCYDPVADTWDTTIPLMNVSRSCCELQAVNGRIYAIGGHNGSNVVSSVESWAPGEGSWRMEPSLNVARYQSASAVIGNDIYVFGGYNNGDLASTEVLRTCTAIEVDVDIKPGSCPNPLNVKSKGVLPVAILGSEDINVTEIDVATILLEGASPIQSALEDVAGPLPDGEGCECTTEGPDGFLDLKLKFSTQEIVATLGEVNHKDELTLTLEGALLEAFGGTPIRGADCVTIRGKHKPLNVSDINKDGVVDTVDFGIFSNNWLQSSIVN